ncbi:hypothetical protein B932_1858 [Gluconobacter oxydans H24]|nr:hypothetical protein B932_1858 [Gluconobacter oxydans H24]
MPKQIIDFIYRKIWNLETGQTAYMEVSARSHLSNKTGNAL